MRALRVVRIDVAGVGIDIAENGSGATMNHGIGGRDEGQGRNEYFVSGSHVGQAKGELQTRSAGAERDGVGAPT